MLGKEFAVYLPGHVLRLRLEHGLGPFGARVGVFTGFVHENRGFGARGLYEPPFFWEATAGIFWELH